MKKATERQFTFPKNEIDKGTRGRHSPNPGSK